MLIVLYIMAVDFILWEIIRHLLCVEYCMMVFQCVWNVVQPLRKIRSLCTGVESCSDILLLEKNDLQSTVISSV